MPSPLAASQTTPSSLTARLESSARLQEFLSTHPYLNSHLPVLLKRLQLPQSTTTATSALAREQEREARIVGVLKETLEVDEEVKELYELLLGEGLLE